MQTTPRDIFLKVFQRYLFYKVIQSFFLYIYLIVTIKSCVYANIMSITCRTSHYIKVNNVEGKHFKYFSILNTLRSWETTFSNIYGFRVLNENWI